MDKQTTYDLAGQVIGCAMRVHRQLGCGFCESVYRNALLHELALEGVKAEAERKIEVRYKNAIVGSFAADLCIGEELIIELKAVHNLITAHEVQLVNYLTATGINHGLLLNFGGPSLEYKKKFKSYTPCDSKQPAPRLQG
ncbi:MAG: GxxExxY protein [Akkermansiaceae bacterium]